MSLHAAPSTLHTLPHLIPLTDLGNSYCWCPHFPDEKAKTGQAQLLFSQVSCTGRVKAGMQPYPRWETLGSERGGGLGKDTQQISHPAAGFPLAWREVHMTAP